MITSFDALTKESMRGLAVDVGFRPLVLFVVRIDSLALTMLTVESNEVVCRLEFECRRMALAGVLLDGGSFSTFLSRSGISIVFDLLLADRADKR